MKSAKPCSNQMLRKDIYRVHVDPQTGLLPLDAVYDAIEKIGAWLSGTDLREAAQPHTAWLQSMNLFIQ